MRLFAVSLLLVSVWATSSAQDSIEAPDPPGIPTAEERARSEEAAKQYNAGKEDEADQSGGVETRETVEGSSTVTEYSRGGQVHMLKVKPKNAPAQYIDQTQPGGELEPNDDGLGSDTNVPKWKIGSW